jgi:NAD(P)-dependent dehydrogenase (short-subunit alcohol dehydrogenase family)
MSDHTATVIAPGRVAVVTGAASGIGLGLCRRFAAEGMRVVMADIRQDELEEQAGRLVDSGAEVETCLVDVALSEEVDALRERALQAYGAVHVVCNNAGVGGSHAPIWTVPLDDWHRVIGVNLWGVIHGVRSFVPMLVDQGYGHVVNTASVFGLFTGTLGSYGVSKHAVVALSESLHLDLQAAGSRVGVSVLCPGPVRTGFAAAQQQAAGSGPMEGASAKELRALIDSGRQPEEVAALVVDAINASRFYVLTSTNRIPAMRRRVEAIVAGDAPVPPLEPGAPVSPPQHGC